MNTEPKEKRWKVLVKVVKQIGLVASRNTLALVTLRFLFLLSPLYSDPFLIFTGVWIIINVNAIGGVCAS